MSASEFFKADNALDAALSSQNPSTALKISMNMMIAKSTQSRMISAMTAGASTIHGSGPQK